MQQELSIFTQPETIPTTSSGTVWWRLICFETSEDFQLNPIKCLDDVPLHVCYCSVQFRTTPMDSTGVPHILEHTVLCGSQRFPCRDPFFKMLNRSLSTFMNAFTGTSRCVFVFKWVYVCDLIMSDYINLSPQRVITQCIRSQLRMPKTSRTFCRSIWMLFFSLVSENWTSGKGHNSDNVINGT